MVKRIPKAKQLWKGGVGENLSSPKKSQKCHFYCSFQSPERVQPPLIFDQNFTIMDLQTTIVDLHNVLEYYGDIQMWMLEDVLQTFPETTGFVYEDRQFGTTQDDLYKIMTMWSKIMRG